MKNSRHLKKELDNLKREVSNIAFYLDRVHPAPKDRSSAVNLQHAKAVLATIHYLFKTKFRDVDEEIKEEIKADNHLDFMKRLATTNSPTRNMVKQSENTVETQRSFNNFVKKSIVKRIQDGKQPRPAIRRAGSKDEG